MAKVGNPTQPNKSLHYAQTQCAFVGENPGGDNVAGFLPPTGFGEESRSTNCTVSEKIMKQNTCAAKWTVKGFENWKTRVPQFIYVSELCGFYLFITRC